MSNSKFIPALLAVVAASVAFTASAAAPAGPLVPDGGFESGNLEGFAVYGARITKESAEVFLGGHAVRINPGTGFAYSASVRPNTRYVFSLQGRVANEGEYFRVGVNGLKAGEVNEGGNQTRFQKIVVDFTTGPEDRRVDLFAFKDGGEGAAFIDEFKLEEAR
jgi:hypothetical protein